jgi:cell wall-associated NlpC family hydrolase
VLTGTAVTLDARASSAPDGDALSYSWNLASPAGSTALLTQGSSAQPVFSPDLPGTYVATVTVADGQGASAASSVTITVTAPPVPPAIALGQTEPLSGTVKLSLTGTVTGAVTWYADLRLLGGGNAAGKSRGIDGGANTVGFDCSGLVLYAFAGAGINLPHYSGSQYNMGRKIPVAQMRRGAILLNLSRGPIVDEAALVEALAPHVPESLREA